MGAIDGDGVGYLVGFRDGFVVISGGVVGFNVVTAAGEGGDRPNSDGAVPRLKGS